MARCPDLCFGDSFPRCEWGMLPFHTVILIIYHLLVELLPAGTFFGLMPQKALYPDFEVEMAGWRGYARKLGCEIKSSVCKDKEGRLSEFAEVGDIMHIDRRILKVAVCICKYDSILGPGSN